MNKEMYDDAGHVATTFNRETLPQYLLQAQFAELVELKKIIHELSQVLKPDLIRLLDIGVGDARIIQHLSGIQEIWDVIGEYIGIDVAQNCIDITSTQIKLLGIQDKASVQLLNAKDLSQISGSFDLIITTRFTAGNFYPSHYTPETFKPGMDMSTNDTFTSIFQQAYNALNPGGEIVIGSMYIDNESTRIKQEDAYRYFGWDVMTDHRDCFTATSKGRRSQRFTKQRVYDYLHFIPQNNIDFIPLDTYEYAMMVRIKKPATGK